MINYLINVLKILVPLVIKPGSFSEMLEAGFIIGSGEKYIIKSEVSIGDPYIQMCI